MTALQSRSGIGAKAERLALILLLLTAFAVRIYRLGAFPDTVLADEADNAQSALAILYGSPPDNGVFGLDWTGQPALSAYKEAAFFRFLGVTITAMRLSSAVIGALATVPFYLLLRRQLSARSSFLGTLLLATNVWYLNFSRSGWNCIDVSFHMLMTMLLLMLALDGARSAERARWTTWICFAGAGVFAALGLYGYPSGRIITPGVIASLPIAWLSNRLYWKRVVAGYGLLFVVEAASFAPQAAYVAKHWEPFVGRTRVVTIFNSRSYQQDPMGTLLHQLALNVRGPWSAAVNNTPQYTPVAEPQLDRPTGFLVLIGMVLTLAIGRWRREVETFVWWVMLGSGWIATQVFTVATPNGARGIVYVPILLFFAAVTLEELNRFVSARATRHSPRTARLAADGVVVATVVLAAANVVHYFEWQRRPHTRFERHLYITSREFPEWAKAAEDRLKNKRGISNVGQWREGHPIADLANPYPDATR